VCFDASCRSHPGKKVIQVRQEPPAIQPYRRMGCADIYVDYENSTHATFWFIDKPYDFLDRLGPKDLEKHRECSAIFSSKYGWRNSFFASLASRNINIDFYGKDIDQIIQNERYKGPINQNKLCKYTGLSTYHKSVAIENSSYPNYFTEKLVDCLLTWTLPIYWGCPNLDDFFPPDAVRLIDLNDIESAVDKINKPVTKIEIEAMSYARQHVLRRYNFWAAIERSIATAMKDR